MARSLSFIYLFIILAISYIGGALLFREWPISSFERIIGLYDARVVKGAEASITSPVITTVVLLALILLMARYKKLRMFVLLIGALKSVMFGLSSTFLLSNGMKLVAYSIWWFPFQLVSCFLFLLLCTVLHPPFFIHPAIRKQRPLQALPILIGLLAVVQIVESLVFHLVK